MYYRYKIKSKDRPFLRFLLIFSIIAGLSYFGYEYRQHFMFWKYSEQKIKSKITEIESLKDREVRIKRLHELVQIFENQISNDPLNSTLLFLAGKAYYQLGSQYMSASFSDLVINENLTHVPQEAAGHFINAIKKVKAGVAIMDRSSVNSEYLMILAKSLFYTKYHPFSDILEIIEPIALRDEISETEDMRFYALLKVMSGSPDAGVEFLAKKNESPLTLEENLFTAALEAAAGRHTRSIIIYRELLSQKPDASLNKQINIRLGSIYYRQGLYRESLESYTAAMEIDERDTLPKIWIGKNYFAMGQKDKARAIWSSILAADQDNPEVTALLKVM